MQWFYRIVYDYVFGQEQLNLLNTEQPQTEQGIKPNTEDGFNKTFINIEMVKWWKF